MTYPDLSGKVAVVTGGGSGLGAASAQRLSAEGVRVVVVDVAEDRARAVADGLPGEAAWVAADVSDEADVDRYVDAAVDRFGRIDLHHVNAGIPGPLDHFPDLAAADFDRVIAVNVRGTFLGLRAAFRQYARQGTAGAVVITASIVSLRGSADLIAYQTSKHAQLGLLRGAAVYGGPLGIRVNAVAPGIVPTGLFGGGTDDAVARAATTPARREGTPREIASAVAFLMSDEASYMVGEVVSVDGGAAAVNPIRPSGGAGRWDAAAYDREVYGREVDGRGVHGTSVEEPGQPS